ncbi:serine hydrolase [Steroidobacter sp.]|uniref:serine hydrolase n=1 Tax=Steroidobacter sp. TaxID=1978227 RepID=UPI001A414D19|nr:serine hydrolase [Steroidobacter sp.]MBL8271337.1 serine hydrolase [Steroidobacter sp.]
MKSFVVRAMRWLSVPLFCMATVAVAAPSSALRDLDRYVEKALVDWQVPGAAIGVVQDGKVIYARGFGNRQLDTAPRVDERTLFQIGSMTKAFTAAAIGLLVDEGKLKWDDRVIDHLPAFQLSDGWLTEHVTIRDLLAHRTGIESTMMVVTLLDAKEIVRRARYVEPTAEFRHQYLYSNLMYGVAGQVIEAVTGKPWGDFVKQRLLQPLGMQASGTSPYQFWDEAYVAPSFHGVPSAGRVVNASSARNDNVAMPHWLTPDGARVIPWQSYDNAAAGGAIVSNLTDMLQWLRVQLEGGRLGDVQIFRPETVTEMHAPQMLIMNPPDPIWAAVQRVSPSSDRPSYALGWFHNNYRGYQYVSHSGGILGFPSFGAMLPERRIGVIVLANSFGRGNLAAFNRLVSFRVFDALLGQPKHDWSADLLRVVEQREQEAEVAARKQDEQRLPNTSPSLPLKNYVGEYQNPQVGRVRIELDGEQLLLRVPGAFLGRLEHWHLDTFRMVWTGGMEGNKSFATFKIDPRGRATVLDAGRLFGGELQRVEGGG